MLKIPTLIPAFLLLAVVCCGCQTERFTGLTGDKKEREDSKGDDAEDEDSVAEPVSVGGSYLACFLVNEESSAAATTTDIGCALRSKYTHLKADLMDLKTAWQVHDADQTTVETTFEDGTGETPYHRLLHFTVAYKSYKVIARVTLGAEVLEFTKELNELEPRAEFQFVAAIDVGPWAQAYKAKWPSQPEPTVDCLYNDVQECFAQRAEWTTPYLVPIDLYFFPETDGPFEVKIADRFGANSLSMDAGHIELKGGGVPCIISIPTSTQVLADQDYYVVPVLLSKEGSFSDQVRIYLLKHEQKDKPTLRTPEMEKLASTAFYGCRR